MTETKNEKFIRLRDQRLPKIIHAIDILSNLSASGYECSVQEAEELVAQLDKAVDALAARFGLTKMPDKASGLTKPEQRDPDPDSPAALAPVDYSNCPVCEKRKSQERAADPLALVPQGSPLALRPVTSPSGDDVGPGFSAEGGSSAFSEISWAHDVIGKDNKLAKNRLRRVIDAWKSR